MPASPSRTGACPWPQSELGWKYHDEEWGTPVHNDRVWFEFLILEGAQAGLSWSTILNKREAYRRAYRGFDPAVVARFGARDRARLLKDAGIVRNRLKIAASIGNAKVALAIQKEFGSLDRYFWGFVGGKPIVTRVKRAEDYPTRTGISDALSADLKRRGARFVGSTIMYAFMQATGMVIDHLVTCPRFKALVKG